MYTKTDTRCVIRVSDKYGSFFCGFKKDEILLSRAKKNARIYADSNNSKVTKDINQIIVLSGYTIIPECQLYSVSPDIT